MQPEVSGDGNYLYDGGAFARFWRGMGFLQRGLFRFWLFLLWWVDHTRGVECEERLLWWSHGAFGNKGRLEGAQYRAGRRAPPHLCA